MQRLVATNNPFSCLAASGIVDSFLSIIDPRDYRTRYPIDQLFQTPGDGTLFQQDFKGRQVVADHTLHQVFLIEDGYLQLIAGVYGIAGLRDGRGDQALFGIGGLQGSTHAERIDADGNAYLTDAKNNCIRKLTDPGDGGPWMTSTFARDIWANTLLIDPQGRVLTVSGTTLIEYNRDGRVARNWANPAGALVITGMAVRDDGELFLMTRANSWDIFVGFDRDPGTSVRLAGMLQAEIDAFRALHGYVPNDGALLGEATFHSPSLTFFAPDGSKAMVGGGDVRGVRLLDFITGRCSTLFVDGSWRETLIVLGAPEPNTKPDRPFYITQPTGRTANGYPRVSNYNWINTGAYRRVQDLELKEVPDQPLPPPTGGTMPTNTKYISQTMPPKIPIGQEVIFEVVMENPGPDTWTQAGLYRLGAKEPAWDSEMWSSPEYKKNRMPLAEDMPVPPGARGTFRKKVIIPPGTALGKYNCRWQMVRDLSPSQGGGWFGELTPNVVVEVVAAVEPPPPPPPNEPPTVEAGSDQAIVLPNGASLSGITRDPEGKPVTVEWIQASGPGDVIFSSPTEHQTTAQFSEPGDYVIRLVASDGINRASDEVTITVVPKPEPPPPPPERKLKITIGDLTAVTIAKGSGPIPIKIEAVDEQGEPLPGPISSISVDLG